ncbi:hypothetical protein [Paenibacillus amylolyticus]|uniref:hypothetical protein n=1 Tax=Paenibacillus amylolyticus TaxID=1451 RepID=UPI0039B10135
MLKVIGVTITLLLSNLWGVSVLDNEAIKELNRVTNFNIYVPKAMKSATHYEIKSPENLAPKIDYILINYFDENNRYVFGIRQLKNNSIVEKELVTIDIKTGSEKSKIIPYKVQLEPKGERVDINGNTGWYVSYIGKQPTGGILTWIQEDTYMEIDTSKLDKNSVIEIAKTMEQVNGK